MEGWIKLYRDIIRHWIFKDPAYFRAWIIILLNVNHEDKLILIEKELIECKRGQSLFSLQGWTKLFGQNWTIQKTRTFFELLKKDSMINTEGLRKTTRLTVCNYELYQNGQQADNKQTTSRQQADNILITTNNKDKKDNKVKKEKNVKKQFIPPSLEEVKLYFSENSYKEETAIKAFNYYSCADWKDSKGNPVINWKQKMIAVWFKPENMIPLTNNEYEQLKKKLYGNI